jgi:hypothetical protein
MQSAAAGRQSLFGFAAMPLALAAEMFASLAMQTFGIGLLGTFLGNHCLVGRGLGSLRRLGESAAARGERGDERNRGDALKHFHLTFLCCENQITSSVVEPVFTNGGGELSGKCRTFQTFGCRIRPLLEVCGNRWKA